MDTTTPEGMKLLARQLFPDVPEMQLLVHQATLNEYQRIIKAVNSLPLFTQSCFIEHPVMGMIPYTPYPAQLNVLEKIQSNKRVLIQSGRQLGTSCLMAFSALWDAIRQPRQTVVVMAHTLSNALSLKVKILSTCSVMTLYDPHVVDNSGTTIEFSNGSVICFKAINADACRGMTISSLYIDNAGFPPSATTENFWMSTYPILMPYVRVVMASSGRSSKQGLFYRLWETDPSYEKLTISWQDNLSHNAAWEQDRRSMLGDANFERLYAPGWNE